MKSRILLVALLWSGWGAWGTSDLPTLAAPLPGRSVSTATNIPPTNLRDYFVITGFQEPVVQFETTQGTFNLALFPSAAAVTVTNFLNYVDSGRYNNSVIHRSEKPLLIQGGGYYKPELTAVPTFPPIPLESSIPNTNNTIAMARTEVLNSATSQWFINRADNSRLLGQGNRGGYAVFGRVTGTGMDVVNWIGTLPTYDFPAPFGQLPLYRYLGGVVLDANYIAITWAQQVPIYPPLGGGRAVMQFTVTNSNPGVATVTLEGSRLLITPAAGVIGAANVTVTATDANGNTASSTFLLQVTQPDGTGGWVDMPPFGWVYNAGAGWFGGSAYGWLWDDPASEWIWSTALMGWMASTAPGSSTVWSTQFRWLTPSTSNPNQADTTSIGPIYVGQFLGAPLELGWVGSDRFGYVWANGDGVWFYSNTYGWLGVTSDGGIWCVDQERFL